MRVQLPPILRTCSGGARTLIAEGDDIAAVMADLARRNPVLARHIFDEAGFLRPSIVFLHAGQLVRAGEAEGHRVGEGEDIILSNALSGG